MTYTANVVLDENGDHILEFTDEIIEKLGWKVGDKLQWKDIGNGEWSLSKLDVTPEEEEAWKELERKREQ